MKEGKGLLFVKTKNNSRFRFRSVELRVFSRHSSNRKTETVLHPDSVCVVVKTNKASGYEQETNGESRIYGSGLALAVDLLDQNSRTSLQFGS